MTESRGFDRALNRNRQRIEKRCLGWRGQVCLLCLLLLAFVGGCARPEKRTVKMSLSAVNTDDKILVLEGTTDLPAGARLKAELEDRDGKTVSRDSATVRRGTFFFDFDLSPLSEFTTYQVVVTFDPQGCPLSVLTETGWKGEALDGPGVSKLSDRRVFRKTVRVLLSQAALGKDWEGRNFEEMEPTERTRLVEELERFIIEKPKDREALLALGRAYLATEANEYAMGSRAHQLLLRAAQAPEKSATGREARELLAQIEKADNQTRQAVKAKREERGVGRYRKDFKILPGKSLGGFRLGAPYRVVSRYFELEKPADFSRRGVDPTVKVKDFHGVSLTYGQLNQNLIAARTTSEKFRLPEGVGVGSLLQEAQQAYGQTAIYTPEFTPAGTSAEGKALYTGVVTAQGIEFEVTREVDADFGIPVDRISAVSVFLAK